MTFLIAQIVSVENAVLSEETTTAGSHAINKVRRRDGGTVCGNCGESGANGDDGDDNDTDGDDDLLHSRDQHQLHHVTSPVKGTPSTILYKLTQYGFVRVESGHLSSKK